MTEEKKPEDKSGEAQGPSKMPDLKEIGAMAGKLFSDVKTSISEIISDYKSKRPDEPKAEAKPEEKAPPAEAAPEAPVEQAEEPTAEAESHDESSEGDEENKDA